MDDDGTATDTLGLLGCCELEGDGDLRRDELTAGPTIRTRGLGGGGRAEGDGDLCMNLAGREVLFDSALAEGSGGGGSDGGGGGGGAALGGGGAAAEGPTRTGGGGYNGRATVPFV